MPNWPRPIRKEGGDYVYLTRALGRSVGFLFAWCQLWIVRPGSIGAMAFVFAEYANQIWPQAEGATAAYVLVAYAVASIVAVDRRQHPWRAGRKMDAERADHRQGRWDWRRSWRSALRTPRPGTRRRRPRASSGFSLSDFGLAMIFVLFTYGGWNEMAFVGAEVKEPRKNILRALLIGTLAVTAIYVLVNLAFSARPGTAKARGDTTVRRRRAERWESGAGPARPSAC